MLRLLIGIARRLGRSIARSILWPSVAYFMLTAHDARLASRDYLSRVLGRRATWLDLWRHFLTFATCALDRIFMVAGLPSAINVSVRRDTDAMAWSSDSRGCLVLLAHIGSFETIRVAGSVERRLPLRIVMDRAHGRMLTGMLERLNPDLASRIIDAAERGPDLVLKLKEALEQGDMVCLMADRVRDGEATVTVDFLGAPARFPVAPWILASALNVPVLLGVGLYRGNGRYEALVEGIVERVALDRRDRARSAVPYVEAYASRLQDLLRSAPYNWGNFYQYWESPPP